MEERDQLEAGVNTFDHLIAKVSDGFGISIEDLLSPGKHPHRVKARSVAAYMAVRRLGMNGTTIAGRMGWAVDNQLRRCPWRETGE